jgi:hypothetical protein
LRINLSYFFLTRRDVAQPCFSDTRASCIAIVSLVTREGF